MAEATISVNSETTVDLNADATEPRLVGTEARVVGPARILIIDDEAAIRESLEALLTLEGFNVAMAADGPTGFEQLAAGEFDLLLLDLQVNSAFFLRAGVRKEALKSRMHAWPGAWPG